LNAGYFLFKIIVEMFLFNLIYNVVLLLSAVILSPVILIAMIVKPKFRAGFWQKLGFYNIKRKETILFHAVSVGEVNAIETLVKKTREEFPDKCIVLTTTTRTGQEIAHKKLENTVDVITYFPFDFAFSVLSLFNAVKPDKILIAETEIWPGFVSVAKAKNIPVYIINGRLSPNSYKGYKKFSFFFKKVLANYAGIFMQTQGDMQRILDIGANPEITKVMGNLKYDIKPSMNSEEIKNLAQELKLNGARMIAAASTHKGEDEIVLEAFCELKKEFSDIKLLIAPRHPERYNQVFELIQKTGLPGGKRSNNDTFENNDIIMLDTMGELMKMFSVSYFAYIGGSFSNTGGHNPLEANIWGKPVVSGNCIFNFKDIYAFLTSTNAAKLSSTPEELTQDMRKLLSDNNFYNSACSDTQKIFDENKGAVGFVVDVLNK
jgi:3-deoxy-D-manno-octulosonic-acid transferase